MRPRSEPAVQPPPLSEAVSKRLQPLYLYNTSTAYSYISYRNLVFLSITVLCNSFNAIKRCGKYAHCIKTEHTDYTRGVCVCIDTYLPMTIERKCPGKRCQSCAIGSSRPHWRYCELIVLLMIIFQRRITTLGRQVGLHDALNVASAFFDATSLLHSDLCAAENVDPVHLIDWFPVSTAMNGPRTLSYFATIVFPTSCCFRHPAYTYQ